MRLRSTQLVFLMLLLCSVQMRAECTLHLVATAVTDCEHVASPHQAGCILSAPAARSTRRTAAVSAVFPHPALRVTAPARAAMAVNTLTGLLRA